MMMHCDVKEGRKNVDIYFLHEFATTKDTMEPLSDHFNAIGYTTINCEYPGHGSRLFEGLSWKKAMDELEGMIKERGNETVLVGSSAGGSLAITLGSRDPGIDKVFAISTPNRSSGYAWLGGQWMAREEARVLPSRTAACKPSNKDRFFLIHAMNDTIVPVREMERNKDVLCLEDENVLLVDGKSGIGIFDHFALKNDDRVKAFISGRIDLP